MGTRIGIETFDALVASSKLSFIDGIIRGEALGKIVGGIISTASSFGGDEAERSKHFFATVDADTFDDLHRIAVEYTVDHLFGKSDIDAIARYVATVGAAFGFQNIRKKMAA